MVWILLSLLLNAHGASDILRVGILDTGLDLTDPRFQSSLCPTGHKDFTGRGLKDTVGHGTHVAGLIKQYAKNSPYCLIIFKYTDQFSTARQSMEQYADAIVYATSLDIKIINISGGGPYSDAREYWAIHSHHKIRFIVAAGNDGVSIDKKETYRFPASYHLHNIFVVGNGIHNMPCCNTNYGDKVKFWENGDNVLSTLPKGKWGRMTGSSMSTAIKTGKLIYEISH